MAKYTKEAILQMGEEEEKWRAFAMSVNMVIGGKAYAAGV